MSNKCPSNFGKSSIYLQKNADGLLREGAGALTKGMIGVILKKRYRLSIVREIAENMFLYDNFVKLKALARQNPELKKQLLDSRNEKNALSIFCRTARQNGCEMYPMDIIEAGEEAYAAMKRSTNGGGENSPMLGTWDNYFESFLDELEQTE